MAGQGDDRGIRRRRVTRGLTFLALAVAVVGPFALVVVGFENDRPLLGTAGLLLGAVVVALVVRRRPDRP